MKLPVLIIMTTYLLVAKAEESATTKPSEAIRNIVGNDLLPEYGKAASEHFDSSYILDLAEVHAKHGAYDLARKMAESCIGHENDAYRFVRLNMLLGSLRIRKGDYQGAIQIYETAQKSTSESIDQGRMLFSLVDAYRHEKMFDSAERLLNELLLASEQDGETMSSSRQAVVKLNEIWTDQYSDLDKFFK